MASRALFRLPFAFLGLLVSSVHEDARQCRERSQDRGEPLDVLVEVDQHPTDGDHQHAEKKRGVLRSPFGCHIGAHDRFFKFLPVRTLGFGQRHDALGTPRKHLVVVS